MSLLFSKTTLGSLPLQNHLVMCPLTRSRAIGNVPNDLMVEYYSQRASAGLIITEGTSPSPNGLGYPNAVHERGAKIFMQLMHTGRVGHPLNLPAGVKVLGPSAVAAAGQMFTDAEGLKPHPTPAAMTEAGGGLRRRRTAWRERLSSRAIHQTEFKSTHRWLRRLNREPRTIRAGGCRCGDCRHR
jgi:N-ethylmaleimide reductase